MKVLAYGAACVACAFVLPASAQGLGDPATYLRGGYVEVEGGSPFQGATTEFNSIQGLGADKGSGHFQAGYFGGAVFGHRIAPGLAVELEGVYLKNRYDTFTQATQQTAGHTQTYGGLANVRFSLPYDFHVAQRFALVPYLAAGAGYGDISYKTGYGGTTYLDDDQSGFMWQAKTGLEVKTGTPISFDLGYRYIGTPDYHQRATAASNASFQLKSHAQLATFGVKYSF